LDGFFREHLEIQLHNGVKGERFASFDPYPAVTNVTGNANVGMTSTRARQTILSPYFDFLLEEATLMEPFFDD
jgi:hypothetical protein